MTISSSHTVFYSTGGWSAPAQRRNRLPAFSRYLTATSSISSLRRPAAPLVAFAQRSTPLGPAPRKSPRRNCRPKPDVRLSLASRALVLSEFEAHEAQRLITDCSIWFARSGLFTAREINVAPAINASIRRDSSRLWASVGDW
jgi:hypothetical protein